MSEELAKLNRAISGDVAHLSKELTGFDLRMMRDPEPLLLIERLRKYAKKKGKTRVVALLDEQEKIVRARQYLAFTKGLKEDITKLGLAFGNIKLDTGIEEDLA